MDKTTELVKLINWLPTKSRIQLSSKQLFPKRREIWWVHLGHNVGAEINGKNERFERPVLVITVFNSTTLFVAPITSTLDRHSFLIRFEDGNKRRSANIFQLRTLSIKRFDRKLSEMSETDFARVINEICAQVLPPSNGIPVINGDSSELQQVE